MTDQAECRCHSCQVATGCVAQYADLDSADEKYDDTNQHPMYTLYVDPKIYPSNNQADPLVFVLMQPPTMSKRAPIYFGVSPWTYPEKSSDMPLRQLRGLFGGVQSLGIAVQFGTTWGWLGGC